MARGATCSCPGTLYLTGFEREGEPGRREDPRVPTLDALIRGLPERPDPDDEFDGDALDGGRSRG